MDLALNLPLNNLSFGQTSFAIIKNLYERKINAKIFPIGQSVDLSAQKINPDLGEGLKKAISNSENFSRKEKKFS